MSNEVISRGIRSPRPHPLATLCATVALSLGTLPLSGLEPGTAHLYRFYSCERDDHFYTLDPSDPRILAGEYGFEGVQCDVYPDREPGTVPLYRLYSSGFTDHLYTTDPKEQPAGYQPEGVQWYVHPTKQPGTLAFHRFYCAASNDNFYTTDPEELKGNACYVAVGIEGYVLPDTEFTPPPKAQCFVCAGVEVPALAPPDTDVVFSASAGIAGDCQTNLSYQWSFGDGSQGSGVQVIHRYAPGNHQWTLTVSGAGVVPKQVSGSILVAADDTVACQGPAELSCRSPIDVASNGDGEGSSFSGYPCLVSDYPGEDLRYSFTAPEDGIYTVSLGGPNGDLAADLDLVVMRGEDGRCGPSGCVAASDRSGGAPEDVSFSASAGEQFVVAVDARTAVKAAFRIELECPAEPQAVFQVAPEFPVVGQQVQFFDLSTGAPIQFGWDFDDGGFATSKNPRKTFQAPGAYNVTFNALNESGSDSTSRQVIVAPANGSINVTGPLAGQVESLLSFQAQATGCQAVAGGWQWLTAGGLIQGGESASSATVRWSSTGAKTVSAVNAGCGAAIGSATVLLQRAVAPMPPAAPTQLRATPVSSTDLVLKWNDNASNEDGFRVERLDEQGVYREIGRAAANSTSLRVSLAGVAFPTTTVTTLRVVAFNAEGDSLGAASGTVARVETNEVEATTAPESCDSDLSLCLLGKRFKVEATWVARNFGPGEGVGHPVALTEDTGYFWFFNPENVELVVKVLDGRAISNPPSYWVFFGALSNVEYTIRVTDTSTGNVRQYFNPPGQFASRGDTGAVPSETLAATLAPGGDHALRSSAREGSASLVERALDVDFSVDPTVGRLTTDTLFEDLTQPPSSFRARSWTFGDGSPPLAAADVFTRYLYQEPGTYDVTLQVVDLFSDFFGPIDAATRKVEITPPPLPALSVKGPEEAAEGEQVTFSVAADQSCSPAFRGWTWDATGGSIVGRANRPTVEVVFDDAGEKTVTVGNSRCGDAEGSRAIEIVGAGAGSGAGSVATSRALVPRQGSCQSSDSQLCIAAGRFSARVQWKDFENRTGAGRAERVSDETGYFWFFNEENVELIVKVLDGRAINGNFWVFYGALSNVEYTLTVTDTETGMVKTYFNPSRNFGSLGDTSAFPGS